MRDELPEERPYRRDLGVRVVGEVDAKVARATRTAELMQRLLVTLERGQVLEQRAVTPAVDGCVDPFGRQAMISGDTRGVLAHRSLRRRSSSHLVSVPDPPCHVATT